jgi:hypothetical protein
LTGRSIWARLRATSAKPPRRPRTGLALYIEGWQPGLLAVFVAGVPALLAVPRPVAPVELPEPMLEPRALAQAAQENDRLATAAERQPLDTDVRELGSALRAYGVADATGDDKTVGIERQAVAEAARLAGTHGDESLARLRAYELRSFLRELRRWEATGVETDELRELGGPFVARAQKNGWVEPLPGAPRHLLPDDTVRAVLFKKRWSDLTLARGPLLDPSAAELRALARFLLLHPPRDPSSNMTDPRDAIGMHRIAEQADQYRLKKIDELRALDPSYPADLARGVVFYRLRRFPQAVESFRRHLEAHPDGGYAMRAQNYLRAALGGAMEVTP